MHTRFGLSSADPFSPANSLLVPAAAAPPDGLYLRTSTSPWHPEPLRLDPLEDPTYVDALLAERAAEPIDLEWLRQALATA